MNNRVRPTTVNEKIYIRFGNVCREKRESIGEIMERLMSLYVSKGDKLFK